MQNVDNKREREKVMVSQMIALYCRGNHHTRKGLCEECAKLEEYARMRSDKCPFMETKTFCSNCKVLPAADERADQTGHALFRTKDAVPSPGHGNQTLNRKS